MSSRWGNLFAEMPSLFQVAEPHLTRVSRGLYVLGTVTLLVGIGTSYVVRSPAGGRPPSATRANSVVAFPLQPVDSESPAAAQSEELVRTLLQIEDTGLQSSVLAKLAAESAGDDPAAVAGWLLELPAQLDRRSAIAEVFRRWATENPREAAAFAVGMPAGELRQSALNAALPVWIGKDAPEATAWFDRLDAHPDFDEVAGTIALLRPLIMRRPEIAASWAESITNADQRQQRIATILGAWAQQDRRAAISYLDTTPALTAYQRLTVKEELGFTDGG